ncbi:MAG: c-type cytochrome domain-containing protein [Pseudomonadota bacterium]
MKTIAKTTILLLAAALAGCGAKDAEISYAANVQPILKEFCLECHSEGGPGYEKSGLLMTSHAALMKGTKFGPIIEPGNSISSTLVRLIEGRADPSLKMPHGDKSLSQAQIDTIKRWIDQGAKNN